MKNLLLEFIVLVDQDCLLVCLFFLQRVVVICRYGRLLLGVIIFECLGFEFVFLAILLSGEKEDLVE